jgi:hypothetical protein
MAVKPIPDGYHAVTPYLVVEGAAKLIDFLTQAFDAQETFRMPMLNADKDLDVMLNGSYFRRGLVRLAFG